METAQLRPEGADGGRAAIVVLSPLPTDSAGNGLGHRPRVPLALARHYGCMCLCVYLYVWKLVTARVSCDCCN